ncbi:MAG: hypothetical protein K7J15_04245, partial [Candidatus Regiella insecticola]|nr:hypothetical protein [Candidatus Regiella insecticola]
LLMEENDRLQKQVSHLVYENGYFKKQTQRVRIFVPFSLSLSLSLSLLLHVIFFFMKKYWSLDVAYF